MESNKDIRWKQRFQNFEKVYKLLERTIKIKNPSEAEKGGTIQFYEITFELSWKILKDFHESQGFIVKSPREAIKQAIQSEIIEYGHIWMDALNDRNLTSHTYDEESINIILEKIVKQYFPVINDLYNFFENENGK